MPSTRKQSKSRGPKPPAIRSDAVPPNTPLEKTIGVDGQPVVLRSRGVLQVYTHLFQLSLENYKRWVGFNEDRTPDEFVDHPHIHWFRTFTSKGQVLTSCGPNGGHYHRCSVVMKDGKPVVNERGELQLEVGPAIERVMAGKGRNRRPVERPVMLYEDAEKGPVYDTHKHTATYNRSQLVTTPTVNEEAARLAAGSGGMVIEDPTGAVRRVNPAFPAGSDGNPRELRSGVDY